MLVTVTTATTLSRDVFMRWTVTSSRIDALAWPAWSFLIYPLGAVGRHLDKAEAIAVAPALMFAVGALLLACRWAANRDVPLEAAQ
jgi:hypothetical protein